MDPQNKELPIIKVKSEITSGVCEKKSVLNISFLLHVHIVTLMDG